MKKVNFLFSATLLIFSSLLGDEPQIFLVFGGKTGWFGRKIVEIIKDSGHIPLCAESRIENREEIIKEIEAKKPDYIINAAGIIGKPNVDWHENNKEETIRINILGTLNLIDVAFLKNIHVTNFTTGCIYEYDEKHSLNSEVGFKEEEEPNFKGSFYSRSKVLLEKLVLEYPHVLNLRVKMPISLDMNPRGFISKILNYKKVINIPNSLCYIDELFPLVIRLALQRITGNFNLVNPGVLSHNEILDLYKEIVDPHFAYENFSLEEQAQILKCGRSNCRLDCSKIQQFFPEITPIREIVIAIFKNLAEKRTVN